MVQGPVPATIATFTIWPTARQESILASLIETALSLGAEITDLRPTTDEPPC